jgi:aspartyl-tRNA(Asn)/glutamyl-tRNA(Gln) amidotransferase subunit A
MNYYYSSITELSRLIQQKQLSPIELVRPCLERIKQLQPKLNAFITVLAEQALAKAKQAEQEIKDGNWKGPLHGIPVGIKDFFDTAGIKTTAAFEHFQNRVPSEDAVIVKQLKDAGAIVIGKTNMHELGMGTTSVDSYFGSVHNPWQQDYVAGGSSGGSAAAVATGLCYATVDTDAVGSCRLPAACCGVVGLKPTYGLLSSKGVLEGEQADETILKLSHTAVTCRTVEDTAMVLAILAEHEGTSKNDYTSAFGTVKNLRLGIVKNFTATDEVQTIFAKSVEVFHSLEYMTSNIDVPFESASFSTKTIDKDRQTINDLLFKDVDLLLLPTITDITPTIEAAKASGAQAVAADNTFFCNYYGLPAISVPCGFSHNGLPLGLQIVGTRGAEGKVLAVAYSFQQATQWHLQHPVLA